MDLNVLPYLALFLIICGLLLASLVKKKIRESTRNTHTRLPVKENADPQKEFGDEPK